jgi:hypothetical protein
VEEGIQGQFRLVSRCIFWFISLSISSDENHLQEVNILMTTSPPCFIPTAANPPSFKYPKDHLFRILGFVMAERLANPDFYDKQGNAAFIVAKDGQSSDLTFGRYSAMEAYTCDEFDHDSWEVAVFNYDRRSGNFSAKGDSGSLIFNAEGQMVAILHSGMPRGFSSHVTFATPTHFVIDQIKLRYPKADFARLEF